MACFWMVDGRDEAVLARLSSIVLGCVALGVGCSTRVVGPDDFGDGDAGDTADSGGDTGGTGAEADGSGDDGPGDDGPPTTTCVDDDDGWGVVLVCLPDTGSCGSCEGECAAKAGTIADSQGDVACGGWEDTATVMCSAVDAGQCCQLVRVQDIGCAGRPLVVGGRPRVAELEPRHDWIAAAQPVELAGLDLQTRCELAGRWREMAQAEHASVASFARFCLDLVSVGAPASLLSATQRAIADEIEHARLCFAMATAYDGHALGPAELTAATASGGPRDVATIVSEAIAEGCVEETISAALAAVAAARATDPAVARVLRKIARDEERHAALAWSFVRFVVQIRPDLRDAVAAAFARAARPEPDPGGAADADLSEHGMLGAEARRAVARATLRDVVEPARASLLSR